MEKLNLITGALSDRGRVKKSNQDNILVLIGDGPKGEFGLFAVCDGLGGLSYGEIASSMAVLKLKEWWENTLLKVISQQGSQGLAKSLERVIIDANQYIREYGLGLGENIGTTLSVLFLYEDNYYAAHVGDSRIYKVCEGIEQLTEDHSYVAQRVRNNEMTKEEAKNSPKRNILVQCVGVKEDISVFTTSGKFRENDIFIVCSDGFYNTFEDIELLNTISMQQEIDGEVLQELAIELVELVKQRGETDNISVIFVGSEKENIKKPKGVFSRIFGLF